MIDSVQLFVDIVTFGLEGDMAGAKYKRAPEPGWPKWLTLVLPLTVLLILFDSYLLCCFPWDTQRKVSLKEANLISSATYQQVYSRPNLRGMYLSIF